MKELGVKEAIEYLRRHFDDRFFDGRFDARSAQKKSIEALEKQIPIKPIGRHTNYKCPICDRRVRSGKGSSSFGVDYFCQRCGQALDWSDTE